MTFAMSGIRLPKRSARIRRSARPPGGKQRRRQRVDDVPLRDAELRRQNVEQKHHDEKIECVERPAEESGEHGVSGGALHQSGDCTIQSCWVPGLLGCWVELSLEQPS